MLLLVALPVLRLRAQSAPGTARRTLRVGTYNVLSAGLYGKEIRGPDGRVRFQVARERTTALRDWIRQQNFDILCLQETAKLATARYLATTTDLRHYHFDVSKSQYLNPKMAQTMRGGKLVKYMNKGYPVTILSRFPLSDRQVVRGKDRREMMVAKVQVSPTQSVWICGLHAAPGRTILAAESYAATWQRLKDEPTIVCGDFNTSPAGFRRPPLATLPQSGYVDVWERKHAPEDSGGTFGNSEKSTRPPGIRIDFLWASKSLAPKALSAQRIWPTAVGGRRVFFSDHCPVVATFDIPFRVPTPPAAPVGPVPSDPQAVVTPTTGQPGDPAKRIALPAGFEEPAVPAGVLAAGDGTLALEFRPEHVLAGRQSLRWSVTGAAGSVVRLPLKAGALRDAHWLTISLSSSAEQPHLVGVQVKAVAARGDGAWSQKSAVQPGKQTLRLPLAGLADARNGLLNLGGDVTIELSLSGALAGVSLLLDDIRAVHDPAPSVPGQPSLLLNFGKRPYGWPGFEGVQYEKKPPATAPARFDSQERMENYDVHTPDPLVGTYVSCHHAKPAAAAKVRVPLPQGRYQAVVWLVPIGQYLMASPQYVCRIDSRQVAQVKLSGNQFLGERGAWAGWKALQEGKPGRWEDLYGGSFKRVETAINHRGSSVDIDFYGCGIAAVAFVAAEKRTELEAWLGRQQQYRREYFRQWVYCGRPWIPAAALGPPPAADAGLNAWQASASQALFGNLKTRRNALKEGIELAGSAGERLATVLVLHGEACTGAMSVRGTMWEGPAGTRHRPELALVGLLPFPLLQEKPLYVLRPWMPTKRNTATGASASLRYYLLKVQIPADAAPGRYQCAVSAFAAGRSLEIPLRVTVNGLRLAGTDPVDIGFEFDPCAMASHEPQLMRGRSLPRSLPGDVCKAMADLGFNTIRGWFKLRHRNGRVTFDTTEAADRLILRAVRSANLCRKHRVWVYAGKVGRVLTGYGFRGGRLNDGARMTMAAAEDYWQATGAEPMYVGRAYTEYSDPVQAGLLMTDMREFIQVVSTRPRSKIGMYFHAPPRNPKILDELLRPSSWVCLEATSSLDGVLKSARTGGKRVCLVSGQVTRYGCGFQLHRLGAGGRWGLDAGTWARPFDPTWPYQQGVLVYTPDGVVTPLGAEPLAEGIRDLRVVLTLESLLKEAEQKKVDAGPQQQLLRAIEAEMASTGSSPLGSGPGDDEAGWQQMDSWRQRLREAAAALKARLK